MRHWLIFAHSDRRDGRTVAGGIRSASFLFAYTEKESGLEECLKDFFPFDLDSVKIKIASKKRANGFAKKKMLAKRNIKIRKEKY